MTGVDRIFDDAGAELALIVRADVAPGETTFLTDDASPLQLGFVVYGERGEVARHRHLPIARHLDATTEVLVVRSGRCMLDVYDDTGDPVAERELRAGDVVLLRSGGHGLRMLEDTVLLEVKQGPYTGVAEKERF